MNNDHDVIETPRPLPSNNKDKGAISIQREIDWPLLMERRPALLAALGEDSKFNYLLLPEVNRLLNTAKHTQDRFIIASLWYTGVRISELLQLRRDDLSIQTPKYAFYTIKSLKKRATQKVKTRVIEIEDPYYIDMAEVYIKSHQIQKNHLLFHSHNQPRKSLNRTTIYRRIEKLATQCGFTISVTPHTMRHSFAINALLHGTDIKTVQTWLGHADTRTTEIYLRVLSGDVGFKMKHVQFR